MKLKSIANTVSRKVGRQVLSAKKNSPRLMFAAGVVGIGATVVLACKATLKVDAVLDEVEGNFARIEQASALGLENYGTREQQRDKVLAYTKAALAFGKLYGPAIIVGGLSIAALTGAHVTLNNRLAGVTAAYAALEKGFKEYRKRVVNEYGEEKDREFRYGVADREYLVEGEHGPEVVKVRQANPGEFSIYAKLFASDTTRNWKPQSEYNMLFLRAAQNFANQQLHNRGHLLLNDVYDHLGFERTKEGCVVGWVLGKGGDEFVDFGIWDDKNMDSVHEFMTGKNGALWLDFNVDGVVYDKI